MGYGRASPQLLLTAAGSPQRKLLLFVVRCMTCDIHWIMAVKAGFAQRQITRHGLQIAGVHITQGVSTDHGTDFISRVGRSNQLFIGWNVCSKVTRIQKRWRTDTDMNTLSSGIFQHTDEVRDGCSADYGVVNKNNTFAADNRF